MTSGKGKAIYSVWKRRIQKGSLCIIDVLYIYMCNQSCWKIQVLFRISTWPFPCFFWLLVWYAKTEACKYYPKRILKSARYNYLGNISCKFTRGWAVIQGHCQILVTVISRIDGSPRSGETRVPCHRLVGFSAYVRFLPTVRNKRLAG